MEATQHKGEAAMQLSQETYERLKEEIESKVMGATNSEAEYHAMLVLIAEDINGHNRAILEHALKIPVHEIDVA